MKWTPSLVPLSVFFKLAFFKAAIVIPFCLLMFASVTMEKKSGVIGIPTALPLRLFRVPILSALGALLSILSLELVETFQSHC